MGIKRVEGVTGCVSLDCRTDDTLREVLCRRLISANNALIEAYHVSECVD